MARYISQSEARYALLRVPPGALPRAKVAAGATGNQSAAGGKLQAGGRKHRGGFNLVLAYQSDVTSSAETAVEVFEGGEGDEVTLFEPLPRIPVPHALNSGQAVLVGSGGGGSAEELERSLETLPEYYRHLNELVSVASAPFFVDNQNAAGLGADLEGDDGERSDVFLACVNGNHACVIVPDEDRSKLLVPTGLHPDMEFITVNVPTTGGDKLGFVEAEFSDVEAEFSDEGEGKDAAASGEIVSVGAGHQHFAVLRQDGSVWTAGLNTDGQLGMDTNTDRRVFTCVPLFFNPWTGDGKRVTHVSCGAYHTLFAAEAQLFGAGEYSAGITGSTIKTNQPQAIVFFDGKSVSRMAGGWAFNVVEADGRLYSFGKNDYGQLMDEVNSKRKHRKGQPDPLEIDFFGDDLPLGFACGYDFTFIHLGSGRLFAAGCNDVGQLGLGIDQKDRALVPTLVEGLIDRDIQTIYCGMRFSMLEVDGSWYAAGHNVQFRLPVENSERSEGRNGRNGDDFTLWPQVPRGAELADISVVLGGYTKAARKH